MKNRADAVGTRRALIMAFELHALIGRLKRRFRAEAYPGDCSPSQVAVLHHLEFKGPATVTTLARVEGVRPQSMGGRFPPWRPQDG